MEPAKVDYLAWKKGSAPAPPRQASVCFQVLPNPLVHTCCCDVGAETVTAWKEVPDVVPWATPDDCVKAEEIAKADEGFKKALEERYGITDMDLVVCDPWSIHAMPEGLKVGAVQLACYAC
ncbi:hypothetical protein DUNSADRAFT_9045 [Dunaliella salina]|uniref:Uncharacterized protein n=1 Tax=Dunaliella salina TaxID=3046 RepID=A0ABQ7FSI4_DUNSA|nr:hypothetical protein DUNSADRAFT_9045 [Dunaliella salina]|eukprot:KAF5825516.1 hypothetical protein DUNSADRAFT_9045 [Dunaliella salina]